MPEVSAAGAAAAAAPEIAMQVRDVRVRPGVPPLDGVVERGEIIGVAGLDGHGQEEYLEVLCGLRKPVTGEVRVQTARGLERITSLRAAARSGVAYLPRDRKSEGILPSLSVLDNFSIAILDRANRLGFLRRTCVRNTYAAYRERLAIVAPSAGAPITSLSGGNQQKVLLARWMATQPMVMVLNDPTRGVDLATRLSIHETLRELARDGTSIVLLSTEIEELLQLCHRALVFREGHVFAAISRSDMIMEAIVAAMFGRHDGSD